MKDRAKLKTADEMMAGIKPGMGAMFRSGSDVHGFYVAKVCPDDKTIGLYMPDFTFKNDWTDGHETAAPFDPSHEVESRFVAWHGKWWKLDREGGRTSETRSFFFSDTCYGYSDPSF